MNVHVINLQKRRDRLAAINANFSAFRIPYVRFEAIEDKNGALGCAKSHVAVLREFLQDNDEFLYVAEDDAKILTDIHPYIAEFAKSDADVLLLGFNTRRTVPYSPVFSRAYECYTTSFYVAKRHAVPRILACFEKSVLDLENKIVNPVDVAWHGLQKELVFVIPKKRVVVQAAGYSDIEKKYVNYGV